MLLRNLFLAPMLFQMTETFAPQVSKRRHTFLSPMSDESSPKTESAGHASDSHSINTISRDIDSMEDITKSSVKPIWDETPVPEASAQNISMIPAEEIISKVNITLSDIEVSPPLTFEKYLTMQGKRVNVTIRFSQIPGLRPYFLTIARKIKQKYPDVLIEKAILPTAEEESKNHEDIVFDILVDGKLVSGKSNIKWHHVRRSGKKDIDNNKVYGMSVYLSISDIDVAIAKARKKRRPSTAYSDEIKSVGLQLLKEDGNE